MSIEPVSARVIDSQNPWPGLDAFDEATERFFNGRDAESAELLRLVGQAPLTVLFGKSGLGKTSLLQAGLFPRLRKQNVLPVYVRLNVRDRGMPLIQQAAAKLQAEIREHGVEASAPVAAESLWEHLHGRDVRWWSRKNQLLTPLFVFDQFEETFTMGAENADAIDRLRLDLADLIENRIPAALAQRIEAGASAEMLDLRGQRYKVLLSFREDFLPEVEEWKSDLPSLMRNRLRLLPMVADRALEVVNGKTPTGPVHELVSEETARGIVRFVACVQTGDEQASGKSTRRVSDLPWNKLEIEPALLSLVCWGLNEKRKARDQANIDAELVKQTGNAIIGDFYQRCLVDVPDKTRRFIESSLITEGGFRNSYPLQDALEQGVLSEPLLRKFVDRRLLRIERQLGADRVELIHDRLTPVVRQFRDLQRRKKQRGRLIAVAVSILVAFALTSFLWEQTALYRQNKAKEAAVQNQVDGLRLAVLGKYDDALNKLTKSLSAYRELGEGQKSAIALVDIGKMHVLNKHYDLAKKSYEDALNISKENELGATEGLVLESLASLSEHIGHTAETLDLYSQAYEKYAAAGDVMASARIQEGLAAAAEERGQYDIATGKYRGALKGYEIAGDALGIARARKALVRTEPWGFLTDLRTGAPFPMRGEKVTVGRNTAELHNDVSLSNSYVSRRHLVISFNDKKFQVDDLRSANGTAINGKRLTYGVGVSLSDGDVILLANVEVLQFTTAKTQAQPPPASAWGIFINGKQKKYNYLTASEYSLIIKGGQLTLEQGFSQFSLLKLRHGREKVEMFELEDDWSLILTSKVSDYNYEQYVLPSGQWTNSIDLPSTYFRLSADKKQVLEEGPSFQLILMKGR